MGVAEAEVLSSAPVGVVDDRSAIQTPGDNSHVNTSSITRNPKTLNPYTLSP